MEWGLAFAGIACLVVGLIGQGFEMRKIRLATYGNDNLASPNIFADKRNFKWYALIGIGIILFYAAENV